MADLWFLLYKMYSKCQKFTNKIKKKVVKKKLEKICSVLTFQAMFLIFKLLIFFVKFWTKTLH